MDNAYLNKFKLINKIGDAYQLNDLVDKSITLSKDVQAYNYVKHANYDAQKYMVIPAGSVVTAWSWVNDLDGVMFLAFRKNDGSGNSYYIPVSDLLSDSTVLRSLKDSGVLTVKQLQQQQQDAQTEANKDPLTQWVDKNLPALNLDNLKTPLTYAGIGLAAILILPKIFKRNG
jgi:hypothetical protein